MRFPTVDIISGTWFINLLALSELCFDLTVHKQYCKKMHAVGYYYEDKGFFNGDISFLCSRSTVLSRHLIRPVVLLVLNVTTERCHFCFHVVGLSLKMLLVVCYCRFRCFISVVLLFYVTFL